MRDSVQAKWYDSIKSYEGYTNWLYFDTHNPPLATTGVGNMIDSSNGLTDFGLALPWRFTNGLYATEKQIVAEYNSLKALNISAKGGNAYKQYARLFISEDVVQWMVDNKTSGTWSALKGQLPDIESWPADAQLALLNMAWWMGPYFLKSWPNLTAALKAQDWYTASLNCTTINPSRRNPDNVRRFQNAAKVRYAQGDYETLYDLVSAPGLLILVTKNVATARADSFSTHAKYVQMMLAKLGFYKSAIDGLFGNVSKTAFANWAKSAKVSTAINITTLTALSKASGFLMPVSA